MAVLNITGGAISEGTFGQDNLITYTLTLDEIAEGPVTVEYTARSGTAGADLDFDEILSSATIPAGELSTQITIRTNADDVVENDETVLVDFFNLSGADFSNGQARVSVQGLIIDDDGTGLDRVVTVGDATIVEGDNGTTLAEFEVLISRPSDFPISIDYATQDGSAVAGSDYTATSGTLTFAPGQSSQTVTVEVTGDTAVEGLEQFTLAVEETGRGNPLDSSGTLAVDFAAGTATIVDDDASASLPSMSLTGGAIIEGSFGQDNLIIYTVLLSEPALTDVTFDYTARSGTAGADADFDEIVASLTIPAGVTTAQFSVRTEAEAIDEADENVLVQISNVEGAVLSNGQDRISVQGVILDDDGTGQKRTALVNEAVIVEGDAGTTNAVFEIRLSQPSSEEITLSYQTQNGTAIAGQDFTAQTGSVTFAPGQTVQSVSVPVLGDSAVEGSEQFTLLVAPASGDADQLAVDFAAGIGTIIDDDASATVPSLSVTAGSIIEGSFGQDNLLIYTISLSEPALSDVTFDYSARPGTAGTDTDYDVLFETLTIPAGDTTAQISVRTNADGVNEADENVMVDFFNLEGAAFSNGQDRISVQGVILDDDGTGTKRAVTVSDTVIVEDDNGSTAAVFELRLSEPSDQAISFDYTTIQGSAGSNDDFTGVSSATNGQITFQPGQTIASVSVAVAGDASSEPSESFQLLLTTTSGEIDGGRGGALGTATILDDDSGFGLFPEISLSGTEIIEGSFGQDNLLIYTVSLSAPSSSPVTMQYNASSGTADVVDDFDTLSDTLTIPAGDTTAQIAIRTNAESLEEADETAILTLSSPTNAVFAGNASTLSASGTILDDDTPAPAPGTPQIFVNGTSADEGDTATFTLFRIGTLDEATTGTFTALPGTANSGSDFAAVTGQFSFEPGQNIATVEIPLNTDDLEEAAETVVLELSGLSNGIFAGRGDEAYAIGTINDVAPASGDPVAADDSFATDEQTEVTGNLFAANGGAADFDPDGDALTITSATNSAGEPISLFFGVRELPSGAGLQLLENGDFIYRPFGVVVDNSDFQSLSQGEPATETITYTVSDGNGGTDTATVTFNITGVNDAPAAGDDAYDVGFASDLTVPAAEGVLENDLEIDTGDVLSATLVDDVANGSLTLNSDGSFTYTPDAGFAGQDSFTYITEDGIAQSEPATVTLTVAEPGPRLIAAQPAEVTEGDAGLEQLTVTLTRSGDLRAADTVLVGFQSGSAGIEDDFFGNSTEVSFEPGQATATVGVDIIGDLDVEGTESFSVTLSTTGTPFDSGLTLENGEITILDNDVANTPPVANDFTLSVAEDDSVSVDALANASDADRDELTVEFAEPLNGAVTFNGEEFVYTPDADFNGLDSFNYTVDDGNGGTATATVDVVVDPVNDDPIAVDDGGFSTPFGTQLVISEGQLLANDDDGDPEVDQDLFILFTTGGVGGFASFVDGAAVFTPDEGFTGAASFDYILSDGNGGTDTATVTISVGENTPPVAEDFDITVAEDESVSVDILANTTDVDGDDLDVTLGTASNGSVIFNGEEFRYTPDADFNGLDSFTYTVNDGNGGVDTATVTVSVDAVNDAPVVTSADAFSTPENALGGFQIEASDVDEDVLSFSITGGADAALFDIDADTGVLSFLAAPDFEAPGDDGADNVYNLTIEVSDGELTDQQSVTVEVTDVDEEVPNIPPVAVDDTEQVDEDGSVTIDALGNDVDEGPLTITSVSGAVNGTAEIVGNQIVYTPNADFNGSETLSYTVSDGEFNDSAEVAITINPINDDPVGEEDFATVQAGQTVTVDVLANDSDVDGDDLTIGAVAIPAEGVGTVAVVDNEIVFTAGPETQGDVTLGYQILDGNGGSTASQVTFTVTEEPNTPPVAVDDAVTTDEDTATSINVLTGSGADSDPDGDDLVVTSLIFNDQVVAAGEVITSGPFAALSIADDGTLNLTPVATLNSLAVGESETAIVSYEISDGNGGIDQASVTVTIEGVNDAPDAVDDAGSTTVGAAVTLDLLGDDTDPDASDELAIDALDTDATLGEVTDNGDGTVSYDPNGAFDLAAGESATDTFGYTVSDGNGGFDTATVTVTINGEMEEPDMFVLVRGTLGNDRLRGTDANERFELLGGEIDGVRGGGGSDVFAFADQDGVRDSLRVLDFDTSEDFLDLGDAVVSSTTATANGLTIRIEGEDRDYIYLAGVESFEDVNLFTGGPVEPELPLIEGLAGISDRITGTDEAERIDGLGGPIDAVRGGGGGDVFAFTDAEGIRDSLRILDYEIGVDSIDLGGAAIRSTSITPAGTLIRIDNADRDAIFVANVFDEDDITFVGDMSGDAILT